MMLIEFVAASMMLAIVLAVGGYALNWVMQRLIDANFAKVAKVEVQDFDEQFRRFTEFDD